MTATMRLAVALAPRRGRGLVVNYPCSLGLSHRHWRAQQEHRYYCANCTGADQSMDEQDRPAASRMEIAYASAKHINEASLYPDSRASCSMAEILPGTP
jgi:hypothetical protein